MSARPDTRGRILAIGERHLMRRGYHAFSFADIAMELGIKPAAVHYHFATKPELVIAVLGAYGARFDAWTAVMERATSAERIAAYFEIGRLVAADGRVCPLSMVTAQQEAIPAEVVVQVVGLHARIVDFYVANLEAARASGAVRFEGAAEDEGAMIACTLVGAQLLARVSGIDAYLRVMRHQSRALGLPDRWPPISPSPRSPQ